MNDHTREVLLRIVEVARTAMSNKSSRLDALETIEAVAMDEIERGKREARRMVEVGS